jgi:hypothetical protein
VVSVTSFADFSDGGVRFLIRSRLLTEDELAELLPRPGGEERSRGGGSGIVSGLLPHQCHFAAVSAATPPRATSITAIDRRRAVHGAIGGAHRPRDRRSSWAG